MNELTLADLDMGTALPRVLSTSKPTLDRRGTPHWAGSTLPLPVLGLICHRPPFVVSALQSLNCLHLKRKRKGLAILAQILTGYRAVRRLAPPLVSAESLTGSFSTRPVAGAADGLHRLPSDVLGD